MENLAPCYCSLLQDAQEHLVSYQKVLHAVEPLFASRSGSHLERASFFLLVEANRYSFLSSVKALCVSASPHLKALCILHLGFWLAPLCL